MIPLDPVAVVGSIAVPLAEVGLQASSEDLLSARQVAAGATVFLLLTGLAFLYFDAREPYRRTRQLLSVEPFVPDAGTRGPVAVEGTVRAEEAVVTPLSGSEAVAYEYENQRLVYAKKFRDRREAERMERVGAENRSYWQWDTVESAGERVPFVVETGMGQVAVEPDGATMELPTREVEQSSVLRRWFARVPYLGLVARPKREIERFVGQGDRVLVVGDADEPDAADAAVVGVFTGDDDGVFVVTTRSRRRLVLRSILDVLSASGPGTALLVAGILVATFAVATGVFG